MTDGLHAASAHAGDVYGQLCVAFNAISDGGSAALPLDAVRRLTETLETASRHDSATLYSTHRGVLADAGRRARRLEDLLDLSRKRPTRFAAQLDVLRAAHEAQELARTLDQGAHPVYTSASGRPRTRHVIEPRQFVVTAADLRPPPGALQPIEVTMPGVLIGLAILILPSVHRSRYAEEFRSELQDLPSGSQVGYALRQCLVALSLRRSLATRSWSVGKGATSHRSHAGTER